MSRLGPPEAAGSLSLVDWAGQEFIGIEAARRGTELALLIPPPRAGLRASCYFVGQAPGLTLHVGYTEGIG